MIAVLATVQILHVQRLCDVFGYDFLRNIFLSIKILRAGCFKILKPGCFSRVLLLLLFYYVYYNG